MRVQVGGDLRDLRTDVEIDAGDFQTRQRGCVPVGRHGVLVRDAELVALQPGGDVGVGAGVHIRVDAQAHACGAAGGQGHLGQHVELGLAFHVEAQHAGFQRAVHVGTALAHA
jgi:hypothetical protein